MNEKEANMDFKAYYESLKNQYLALRDEICEKLGIAEKTFYNKYNNNEFDYPQQVVISQIVGKPLTELFPNHESEKVA